MPFLVESTEDGKLLRRWDMSQLVRPLIVGRNAETSSIVIPELNISRNHSSISYQPPHDVVIIDLETRNGTFFNGERIKGKVIADIRKKWSLRFADSAYIYTAQNDDPMGTIKPNTSTTESETKKFSSETDKTEDDSKKHAHTPIPKVTANPSNGEMKMKAPTSLGMMFERPDSPPETNDFDPTALSKQTHTNLYLPESKPVKKKRNFESKWDTPPPAPMSLSSSSLSIPNSQIAPPVYDEKLQAEAAERARLLAEENKKNLKEKRKKLWSRNKEEKMKDSGEVFVNSVDSDIDPNQYSQSFDSNLDKKSKFLKLMGYRNVEANPEKTSNTHSTNHSSDNSRNQQLENQYYQGLKRMDGRKTGLGL